LDVTQTADRNALAQVIAERFEGQLDCLVNNAGYGLFGAVEDMSEAQIRDEMEVNFFGLVLTTRMLLPFVRRAHGRVINISSLLGFSGMPLGSLYCGSKFAVEGFSESLAHELAPHGVQVAVVEPGGFRTNFSDNHLWGEKSWDENSPYLKQTKAYSKFRESRATGEGNPPDPVVKAVVKLAQARKMPMRVRCGKDAKSLYAIKRMLPEWLHTILMAKAYRKMFGGDSQV
jgi:NAD(P)-dependent dehydrogenase (short-subunit alcohol dehydrogenase family)